MAEVDPEGELARMVEAGGGSAKIHVGDLLRRFGRHQPTSAALEYVSGRIRRAGFQTSPALEQAHPTGSVLLTRARTVSARAASPKRRLSFTKEHLYIAAAVATVLGAAAPIVGLLKGDPDNLDPQVQEIARRYVAAFSESGEFAKARAADEVENNPVACLTHEMNGKADDGEYQLCLIVAPGEARGRQVLGTFKRPIGGGDSYDCTRRAEQMRQCS